jgi:hypothetical protein
VDEAQPNDEIHVASGVYTDVQTREDLPQVVYIDKTVTIRGGYTTSDWNTYDPQANPTTLDAQGLGRAIVITGTVDPIVDGLRITGGDATGLNGVAGYIENDAGGGIYINLATATITNCVITDNIASTTYYGLGGGLFLHHSESTLNGNTVQNNLAGSGSAVDYRTGHGGGLYLHYSNATLKDNLIQNNRASTTYNGFGGGLFLFYSDATLTDNTIQNNIAGPPGNSPYFGFGGGLQIQGGDAILKDNVIRNNTASAGHSLYHPGQGGGLRIVHSIVTLENNTIQNNTACINGNGDGGGLYSYLFSRVTLSGNRIISNTATISPTAVGRGGGIFFQDNYYLTSINNMIADNHANTEGSGLWLLGQDVLTFSSTLLHNTVADNKTSDSEGQGIYVGNYTILTATNTIIAGHNTGVTTAISSTTTLEGTLWHDNGTNTSGDGTTLIGVVNVYGDPSFVAPLVWDYHINSDSAAACRGVNTDVAVDIDGEPRPSSQPDIGADETTQCFLPLVLGDW